ncbi:MAG: branched-chain amino acid ABC transporter permease [Candidatus Thiodiazotropha taylori]|nr:branched-chain amino acid ABC transporter permease [Candidatus Thiodiazotropha taylori]
MIVQILLNSFIAAAEIALIGIAFALIYQTAKFIHFAQAATISLGAYITYGLYTEFDHPLILAVLAAIIVCSFFGALSEIWIFRPLRKRDASSSILLLASLGLFITLLNIISLSFGDNVLSFADPDVKQGIDIMGARLSPIRGLIFGISIVTLFGASIWLKYTHTGKQTRAVSSNLELAEVCGIKVDRIILIAFVISSALSGFVGVLLSLDTGMRPLMGVGPLIAGIVAVIVAGGAGIWAIGVVAILIAGLQQLSIWYLGTQWHEVTTFLILLLLLIFKPKGLFFRTDAPV